MKRAILGKPKAAFEAAFNIKLLQRIETGIFDNDSSSINFTSNHRNKSRANLSLIAYRRGTGWKLNDDAVSDGNNALAAINHHFAQTIMLICWSARIA